MKTIPHLVLFPALMLMLASSPAAAETVKASLAASRGDVTVNGVKPGQPLPVTVKVGSVLKSGPNSSAILIPLPGQTVFVDQNTEVQIKTCEMSPGENSTWTRRASCTLKKGSLHCAIAHPKAGASYLDVVTPRGTLSAHGTGWVTWSDQDSTRFVVYAGVVTIHFGAADIDVLRGQVATITGDGAAAVLEVLDLKTGRLVRYTNGAPGQTELASAAQINVARDLLDQGFGAFRGTASQADLLGFSQIVAEINKVLDDNHLASINPPFEWQLWPDWYKLAPAILPPDPLPSLAAPGRPPSSPPKSAPSILPARFTGAAVNLSAPQGSHEFTPFRVNQNSQLPPTARCNANH